MKRQPILALAMLLASPLAGCDSGVSGVEAGNEEHQPFALIGEDETVHFTGTEPFWGGEVAGGTLTYSTPENAAGSTIAVTRFAGRGGLTFSGTLDGATFDLLVSEGACSDGMSDRTYPFTATLGVGEDLRKGCAWTSEHPFTGPQAP